MEPVDSSPALRVSHGSEVTSVKAQNGRTETMSMMNQPRRSEGGVGREARRDVREWDVKCGKAMKRHGHGSQCLGRYEVRAAYSCG